MMGRRDCPSHEPEVEEADAFPEGVMEGWLQYVRGERLLPPGFVDALVAQIDRQYMALPDEIMEGEGNVT